MNGSPKITVLTSLLLGVAMFGWALVGQTSNPKLTARELPRYILSECAGPSCSDGAGFGSHWIGSTPQGDLFLVARTGCTSSDCPHWLVEKTSTASRALLELNGSFKLDRGTGRYPVVEVRADADGAGTMHLRYEWNGQQYTRTSAQRVYAVNGVECGTREECRAAAQRALEAQQVDRATRIWQQVEGVTWI
jgi:hypothetical protein